MEIFKIFFSRFISTDCYLSISTVYILKRFVWSNAYFHLNNNLKKNTNQFYSYTHIVKNWKYFKTTKCFQCCFISQCIDKFVAIVVKNMQVLQFVYNAWNWFVYMIQHDHLASIYPECRLMLNAIFLHVKVFIVDIRMYMYMYVKKSWYLKD